MKNLRLFVALVLFGTFAVNQVNAQATTFNVDMGCAPEFTEAFVTGPFCGWCANIGTNELTDPDGDGIYSVAIDGLAGTVEYKYAINGFSDQENLINDMVDGATCAPITDFAGYANRTTEAGSTTSDYYGTCDGVCNDNPPVTVTFQVDMSDYTGTFGQVNINGSFNGWCGTCAVLTDPDADGVYSIDLVLNAQATVEYKFTLDGWTAQEEFTEGDPCTSTIDGFTNRTLTTGTTNETLNAVCYNSCEACTGTGGGGGGTTEFVDVTFQVDMAGYSGSYEQVNLNGSFNGWCGSCAVLTDDDADGVYAVTVQLVEGTTYEYKFTVDGWTDQESLTEGDACTSTIDGFTNRTLTASVDETLDVVCWNSCAACVEEMVTVTWQVDMSETAANPAGVFVAGSFQGWTAGSSQMTNDGNGVYSYTQEVAAGSFMQWKYLNGPDWAFAETVPPSCGNPDDNYNRYMTLGSEDVVIDVVCFGACVACGTVVETSAVTFSVDMSQQTVSENGVHIAGNLQGWDPAATELMDSDGDGIYSVTLDLEPATYQYKFVNGNAWGSDESVPSECAVDNNREIVVGADDMSVLYCFGQCTATCQAPLDAADITFSVDMNQETVAASGVWLMSGFTTPTWQEGAIQMMDDDGDGVYTVTASVGGTAEFQYKFSNGAPVVDGVVDYSVGEDADFAAAGCGASNGVGGFNRVHTRSGEAETLPVVCYNSCSACAVATGLTLTVDVCDATPSEVRFTGPWWGWDPNGGPVASDNGDGTWSVVLDPIPTDNMEYLWVVDGVQENLIQSMVDGGDCAPITDYANYANRLWEVGSGDVSNVYNSCSACAEESSSLTLTVNVCDAMPSEVRFTGPWWGWDPNGGPVASDNGDGTWSVVLDPIPTDNMEYLWVVDGVQENLIQSMVDGGSCAPITDYANYANRLWEVGSGNVSGDVYNTCGSCDDVNETVMVTVEFAIDMNYTGFPNADYDNVVINGNWNGWAPWGITLADADGDGVFSGSLELEEGTTFEFVIAATGPADNYSGWGSIFNAPTECEANPGLPIGAGGGNYIATAADGLVVAYCAGSCAATCPLPGCTDPFYAEFDMNATEDDGSCVTPVVFGCIYEAAENYNAAANTDDGSCEFAINACPGDLDGDGLVATPDLLSFLSVFGTTCE